MADVFSASKRSEIMSKIRSKNTAPERRFYEAAKVLHCQGIRYRKHYSKLPGKPDLAILRNKVAVFIDSEFWHGKDYVKWKRRLPRIYWREKIWRNMVRDVETEKKLGSLGWKVVRIWSKDLLKDTDGAIKAIQSLCKS